MKEYIVQAIAQETIDSFDAHNAPELIRCRDCKWKGDLYECRFDRLLSEYGGRRTDADDNWFCADGERRIDDA